MSLQTNRNNPRRNIVSTNERVLNQFLLLRSSLEPLLAIGGIAWLISGYMLALILHPEHVFSYFYTFVIIIAFFSARASGMAFNRLIDGLIDSKNPRTAQRLLPAGRVEAVEVVLQSILFLAIFLLVTLLLPYDLRVLSLIIALLIVFYSFTKRFTVLCHYWIGSIHFFIPITGALCVVDTIALIPLSVWALSFSALFSCAASDILYSLQDEEFDRRLGLHSIPACYGKKRAIQMILLNFCLAFGFATISLYFFSSSILLWALWSIVLIIARMFWRSFVQSGYSVHNSLISYVLPFIPFFFSILTFIGCICSKI